VIQDFRGISRDVAHDEVELGKGERDGAGHCGGLLGLGWIEFTSTRCISEHNQALIA
jgi:hypothetical protein